MAIEKIVDSLKVEAIESADLIVAEAQKEADSILAENSKRIEELNKVNVKKAHDAGVLAKSMIIQGSKLKARNESLAAKQNKIEEVFNECVIKLEAMSDDEYLDFVKAKIKSLDLTGEAEILVCEKRHNILTSKVLKDFAKKDGEKFNILDLVKKDDIKYVLCDKPVDVEDGFVVKQGDIYYNYTFKAVVSAAKVDLVKEVATRLF